MLHAQKTPGQRDEQVAILLNRETVFKNLDEARGCFSGASLISRYWQASAANPWRSEVVEGLSEICHQ